MCMRIHVRMQQSPACSADFELVHNSGGGGGGLVWSGVVWDTAQGQELAFDFTAKSDKCTNCAPGKYHPEGWVLDKNEFSKAGWYTVNKTIDAPILHPMNGSRGVSVFCEAQKGKFCQPWSRSADGESLHSGSNEGIGKIRSVLSITTDFTRESNNYIEFQYRVDAELCQ